MIASLCVLAYKRPEWLEDCIRSIHTTADRPFELIVHNDSDIESEEMAIRLFQQDLISKLILHRGKNRGVGYSFTQCAFASEGQYIFKIDSDLIFKPKWLSTALTILDTKSVACLSLFNYNNYDQSDKRFWIAKTKDNYHIVNDFVSSVYGFRKELWNKQPISDDGFHTKLQEQGELVITIDDYVDNRGFGLGKSVYVVDSEHGPVKAETFTTPRIFNTTQKE